MRSNNQQENKALTPMQKQAVLVCIVCALALCAQPARLAGQAGADGGRPQR